MRKLAAKYGANESALLARASREEWSKQRKQTANRAQTKTNDRIADKIAAQNLSDAQIAIKARSLLLQKCLAEAEAAAQAIGTESRQSATVKTRNGDSTTIKDLTQTRKLRDIAETIKTLMDITTLAAMTESDDSFEKAMTEATSEVWTDGDDVPI